MQEEEKKISSGVFLAHKCNQAKQVRSVTYCFADLSHEMIAPGQFPLRERGGYHARKILSNATNNWAS